MKLIYFFMVLSIITICSCNYAFAVNPIVLQIEKEAKKGDVESQYTMGSFALNDENYKQAVYWFSKSANQGHDISKFELAKLYEQGKGCKQDLEKALQLYLSIKNPSSVPNAFYNIGYYHEKGLGGLPINLKEAKLFYNYACQNGVEKACMRYKELMK